MFAFQTNPLNRHGDVRHTDDFITPIISSSDAYYLPVYQQSIACEVNDKHLAPLWLSYRQLHFKSQPPARKHLIYLGEVDSKHYFTYRLKSVDLLNHVTLDDQAPSIELCGLRELFKRLSPEEAHVCNVAIAIEHWHNTHQYCGYCGHKTYAAQAGFVRICSHAQCQQQHFPRTDSAVICAITYQDELLLGRQKSWPEKRYSVIAGFVEPGETLEQAVVREAYEETGLALSQVSYYQSQPWPFPQSLMVGFTAEAQSNQISLLDKELEDARWFSRTALKEAVETGELVLPFEYSISRKLINQWLIESV